MIRPMLRFATLLLLGLLALVLIACGSDVAADGRCTRSDGSSHARDDEYSGPDA